MNMGKGQPGVKRTDTERREQFFANIRRNVCFVKVRKYQDEFQVTVKRWDNKTGRPEAFKKVTIGRRFSLDGKVTLHEALSHLVCLKAPEVLDFLYGEVLTDEILNPDREVVYLGKLYAINK